VQKVLGGVEADLVEAAETEKAPAVGGSGRGLHEMLLG
jgi:hypothetical protein